MGEAYDRLGVDDFQLLAAVLAVILPVDGHGHVRALSGGEGYLRAVGEQEGIDDGVGPIEQRTRKGCNLELRVCTTRPSYRTFRAET